MPSLKNSLLRRGLLAFVLSCITLAVASSAALAATFTVNTTADTTDAGGCTTASTCSLRDAVAAANATPDSTISVPAGHYTLSAGQLALTAATTVDGAGARNTIVDGGGLSRVFDFEPATATDILELSGLTVTGGDASAVSAVTDPGDGGGIFSLGGLDLEHDSITGNTAALGGGGVMDGTIHSPTAPGPATFNAVTIANNTVQGGAGNGQGGGAVVATTLTMTNSTIADNTAENAGTNEGGGLVSALDGSTTVTATLLNDTITGNVASEPVASPAGDMGGGISGDDLAEGANIPFDSVIDATNTIVADNTADGAEQDCALIDTADGTSTDNIEGDTTCGFSDAGSQQTTAIDLGPLQNNGGPTDTLLPAANSPAVNTGSNSACPATDERGVTRPQGSACDIGAVELAPPSAVTGTATAITPTGATVSGTATNPAVADGTAVIDYGTTNAYGQTASAGTVPAGASGATQTAQLTGLTPSTTYHFRIVVTTTDGTATGADATFTTSATPPPAATVIPTSLVITCASPKVALTHHTTCTATVRDAAGSTSTPTGTVTFGSSAKGDRFSGLDKCTLHAGTAAGTASCSLTYTPSATGRRILTATYGGDQTHHASDGSVTLSVQPQPCGAPTGSLSASHLGPAALGATRAQTRRAFVRYQERGRRNMDFFCLSPSPGIRVGYLSGRAVLALTSNHHYHLGDVRPGNSLAKAERTLPIWTHFRIGLNIWYLTRSNGVNGIMKVRHGQVQEIGIVAGSRVKTRAAALRFMSSFPSD